MRTFLIILVAANMFFAASNLYFTIYPGLIIPALVHAIIGTVNFSLGVLMFLLLSLTEE